MPMRSNKTQKNKQKMKTKMYVFLIGLVTFSMSSCKQSDPVESVMQLVWSDEFEGTELDPNKWEVQTGNGSQFGLWNWGNNEEQWYTENNISFSNGNLLIRAQAETIGDYDYTSARIRTLNKGDFKYGRVEASIRMAATPGLWHAFWMLPSSENSSWPETGEIDIMEYVGNRSDEIFNTIHYADAFGNHNFIGDLEPFPPSLDFHIYAIEWDENSIKWFLDDVLTFSIDRNDDRISATWPFDAEFHLLLNTAVGGNLGGDVSASDLQSPKFMEVEYVRVFQAI